MIVTASTHKALLLSLFYVDGTARERRFPLAVVPVAAQCVEKLKDGASVTTSGTDQTIQIMDGPAQFDEQETALLRDLLSSLTEATPTEYRLIEEVKAFLNP